jgi:hypothetical protein
MKEKIALLIMKESYMQWQHLSVKGEPHKESYMQWQHLSVKGEPHAEDTSSGCR